MTSLKTALKTIRRSPYQALLAVTMVSLTLFIAYSTSLLILASNSFLKHIESQPQIIAFFQLATPESEIRDLEKQFLANPEIKTVTVSTQEEALAFYRQEYRDDPLLLDIVTAEMLPASIEIKAHNLAYLDQVKSALENEAIIEEVNYQEDVIATLRHWLGALKTGGLVVVSILALVSFFSLMVIIALKAAHQKNSIAITRLLGASKSFVYLPFVIEGALYGLWGSLIGWTLSTGLTFALLPQLATTLAGLLPTQLPPSWLAGQLLAGSLFTVILGGLAALLAVSRLMRN